jgi:hypothetical protein
VAALEALRAENASLRSRLLAADSPLVDALRNERKAWSSELASQGTSLAQDRGRLEAQTEALAKQLAAESDCSANRWRRSATPSSVHRRRRSAARRPCARRPPPALASAS